MFVWECPVQFSRSVVSNSLRPHELQLCLWECGSEDQKANVIAWYELVGWDEGGGHEYKWSMSVKTIACNSKIYINMNTMLQKP